MKLLVGLGNPGRGYARNRHNIGFMVLDAVAARWRAGPWRTRFEGECSEVTLEGDKAILLKPLTYMNDSGRSVGAALRFFKLALEDVIVFHDELDLAPCALRVKRGGGNAGHNGLRSITALVGNDFWRVRLGIGHPGDKSLVHAHVLSDFLPDERAPVEALCAACAEALPALLRGDAAGYQQAAQRR